MNVSSCNIFISRHDTIVLRRIQVEKLSKLCDVIAHKCIAQNYKQQSKALRLLRFEDSSGESCLCSVK